MAPGSPSASFLHTRRGRQSPHHAPVLAAGALPITSPNLRRRLGGGAVIGPISPLRKLRPEGTQSLTASEWRSWDQPRLLAPRLHSARLCSEQTRATQPAGALCKAGGDSLLPCFKCRASSGFGKPPAGTPMKARFSPQPGKSPRDGAPCCGQRPTSAVGLVRR